jgi:hypothetical protein
MRRPQWRSTIELTLPAPSAKTDTLSAWWHRVTTTAVAATMMLVLLALCACTRDAPDIAPTSEQGADTSLVVRALDTTRYHWRIAETPRTTIYAAATVPTTTVTQVADSIEDIISSHLAWLSEEEMGPKLRLFLLDSRDEIESITGSRAPGLSEPGSGSAFFVLNDSTRMGLRHETMHLLSYRLWGVPSGYWLSEGVATSSVPLCGGLPRSAVVAMLDRAQMLIPLETVRSKFTFAGDTGFVFYLEAADLVQYIDTTYGRDKLRAVWTNGGLANVRETLGVDRATLERDWRAAIAATPATREWPGWPAWRAQLNQHGCS